jgi:putative oxidoreductase
LLTAVVFHTQFDDRNQMVHFMKNLAIVGGLLHIMVMGPGRVSMDASRARKHADDSHD